MDLRCSFQVNATLVANDFIDRYMVSANGEYVKVYLYVLRHQQELLDVSRIAEALNHTEADVKRAILYWEKLGALRVGMSGQERTQPEAGSSEMAAAKEVQPQAASRPVYSQDQVNRLQGDEDFVQLLYIAQKYMNKIFTARECEVFAYLYEGLHMPAELLEYLVEYCVQNGHTSIRYIETVALNWHEKGFGSVEDAKAYAGNYTKDVFAVMRAFGLTDRKPGDVEKEMIERWFQEYGFTREVVLEACHRTIEATHNPSFRYADKILSEWKKAGVRSLSDVSVLDERRQKEQRQKQTAAVKKQTNQFHNFEQRDTDYDSMVLEQVRTWISNS